MTNPPGNVSPRPWVVLKWLISAAGVVAAPAQVSAQVTVLQSPNGVESGYFGGAIAGIGDVDGDGAGEVLVGSAGERPGGLANGGRAYLLSGRTGALMRTFVSPLLQADGRYGAAVARVPDANGDGIDDLLIGAPGEGANRTGRAYLYSGRTGNIMRVFYPPSPQADGYFGQTVAGIGDVDGDGRGDVIVGAPDENGGGVQGAGRIHVFSGASGSLIRTIISPGRIAGGSFGESISDVPDANGDSIPDVLVGAPKETPPGGPARAGRVYLFSGATGQLLVAMQSPGLETDGGFGESVAGIPDLDGDGRGDIVVGAPAENPGSSPVDCGRAYVYSGATGSLVWKLIPPVAEAGGNYGKSVAGMADITGDGRGDIIVGAWRENPGAVPADCGRVHLYSGRTGARYLTLPSTGQSPDGLFGFAVTAVPDTNNNGRPDVAVAAIGESYDSDAAAYAGRVYIIRQ